MGTYVPAGLAATKFRGVGLDSSTSGSDIDVLKEWNVNLVYYFLDPNVYGVAQDEATYLAQLEKELVLLDDRLAQFAARDIKVAINLYGAPGEFVTRQAPSLHRVFAEQWCQQALVATWKKISDRYKGNTTVWGYNLLNEPAQASVASGLQSWRDLSSTVIDAIREIDNDVRIIIQPPYGNPDRLGLLKVIKNKGTVVYSFNGYTPYSLTHQGLYGIKLDIKYPTAKTNALRLRKNLNKAIRYGKKHRVPLFVAEFTIARWAPRSSGALYLRDMARIFEKEGIDWTYHAYYGSKIESGDENGNFAYPWSLTHGSDYRDRAMSPTDTARLKVLKSFFRKNRSSEPLRRKKQ
jgi:endoglucanase